MRVTLLLAAFALIASPAFAQDVLDLGAPGAIPDDGYDGTAGSMLCSTVDNSGGTIVSVTDVSLDISITHTWVGDLTIKVFSPIGTELAVLATPGQPLAPDDGSTCCGDSSDLDGTSLNFANGNPFDAELMGSTILGGEFVCTTDGQCDFFPNPDGAPGTDFDDFDGEDATAGSWSVCVGDGAAGDPGTFNGGTLTIDGDIPVELTSFTATANGQNVNLAWETASETNNAGFEVQIQDGENWTVLGFV
ncbi:MAG: proprotein convertase P-domain-containing protein, partial [Rubricoccaceae bacterium]|nr:proprotein convertase P-domain-containing protein [Rubricoccaceae bacterium]